MTSYCLNRKLLLNLFAAVVLQYITNLDANFSFTKTMLGDFLVHQLVHSYVFYGLNDFFVIYHEFLWFNSFFFFHVFHSTIIFHHYLLLFLYYIFYMCFCLCQPYLSCKFHRSSMVFNFFFCLVVLFNTSFLETKCD